MSSGGGVDVLDDLETGSLLLTVVGHVLVSWFNTAYHVRRNPNMTWVGWTRG